MGKDIFEVNNNVTRTKCIDVTLTSLLMTFTKYFQTQSHVYAPKKNRPENFCKTHRKTPLLKSLFNKVLDLSVTKLRRTTDFLCEI